MSDQSRHDRASRDKRAHSWNRQRTNTREPTQSSANHGSGSGPGGGTFRRLGVFLHREVLRALVFREQDGDVSVAKALCTQ